MPAKRMKATKKMNILLKIFIIVIVVLLVIALGIGTAGYVYINQMLGKLNQEEIDTTQIGIDEQVSKRLKGYRNIAILGIDSRADDYGLGNRSDCIIVASLNQNTNEINLISVYRDTYMYVAQNKTRRLDKITHAYAYGGAQNTLKSLNEALDLNISEYITVNFDAVMSAVDALDGIYIDIQADEIKHINKYIDDMNLEMNKHGTHVTKTGNQKLTGIQALAYSRVRYTEGGDYKRTERIRTVITAMLNKAKTLNIIRLNNFADTILPVIKTNISSSDIWGLMPSLASLKVKDNLGWPYETRGATINGVWYGVPETLESNVVKLHKEAYGQENYEPSDTVKEMNEEIIRKSEYKK